MEVGLANVSGSLVTNPLYHHAFWTHPFATSKFRPLKPRNRINLSKLIVSNKFWGRNPRAGAVLRPPKLPLTDQ